MIVAAERIADVVKQSRDDIFLSFPAAMGAGRGLQAVLQPIDRKAAIIAIENLQMRQHPISKLPGEWHEMLADNRPVLGCAFVHVTETCLNMVVHRRSPRLQSRPNSSSL